MVLHFFLHYIMNLKSQRCIAVSGTSVAENHIHIIFMINIKPDSSSGAADKEEVAPSENAISLYVDDPDDAATR